MPTADNRPDEQAAMVRAIDQAEYDAVAFCPVEMRSQLELVNELADRTKLVTIGKVGGKTHCLCHVGFCQECTGRKVATLACSQLPRAGKVMLLTTVSSDAERNTRIRERLQGFKDEWNEVGGDDSTTIVSVSVDLNDVAQMTQNLPATLADPELVSVVAFDATPPNSRSRRSHNDLTPNTHYSSPSIPHRPYSTRLTMAKWTSPSATTYTAMATKP